MNKSGHSDKRAKLRKQFWPDDDAWTGEGEKGWFQVPRTLPLILYHLVSSKPVSGNRDATSVYLELWSRHMGGGVVEMKHEGEHAYAAGYIGSRAVRTWQERMKILEKQGFIKTKKIGNHYKYVLLVHPTFVVQQLRASQEISQDWLNTYRDRQIETKEASYEDRQKARQAVKVMPLKLTKSA